MNERSIFLAALDIPDPARRAAYLEEACAGDPAARREVEELLAAHERSGSFMPEPAEARTTGNYWPGEEVGSRIGPYKLLEKLGEGGMGEVWVADQQEPIRRRVALKVIKPGMDSRSVLARFEAERQALALMDHPNIAKVLDAGATDDGRPYFAMELVKGTPITQFCDARKLSPRERLELFVPVCQAIQHAHQKGVIHRDIKPGNVLVALHDERPVPKVIDFGVAKAVGQQLTEKTVYTGFGMLVGTPAYMAPEQATFNQLDVDTRADVYALGVLLYELLAGSPPFEPERLRQVAFDEVLRLVREEEPPRPSDRLSTSRQKASIAAVRQSDPDSLTRQVRGELDWVVMKALEKDRTRRYETANGLARDIQRYLKDEPVEACPPTVGYRLRKLYQKNRAALAVAAAFVLLLALATVVSTALAVQARQAERAAQAERVRAEQGEAEANEQREQAERQRQRAEREQRRADEEKKAAQAVRDFLTEDLLRQASPLAQAESLRRAGVTDTAPKPNPTVKELLDRAVTQLTPGQLEARFPGLPFVQAEVLRNVAVAYLSIQERNPVALELLTRAHALYLKSRGPDDRATLNVRHSLALAHLHLNRFEEGKRLLEAVRDDKVRVLGPHDRDTVATQLSLGLVLANTSRPADAISHLRKLRDAAREHLGPDDIDTLYVTGALAMSCRLAGRHEEALQVLEGLWATIRRLKIRFDHPGVQQVVQGMDATYKEAGRHEDAIAVLREALAGLEKANGAAHPETWYLRHQLASRHVETNRPELAVPLFQKNVAAADNVAKAAATHEALSKVLKKMGRTDEALTHLKKSVDALPKADGPERRSWANGIARARLGQALLDDERFAEAEAALASAYEELTATIGQRPPLDRNDPSGLPGLLTDINKALGRPDGIKKWAAMRIPGGEINVARLRKQLPKNASAFLATSRALCWAYADAGRNAEAVKLFEEALAVFKTLPKDTDYHTMGLVSHRHAVTQAGRPDLAIEMSRLILEALRKRANVSEQSIAIELYELGYHLCHARRYAEAETTLRESLAIQNRLAPNHWNCVMVKFWLATALFRQKKYAETEPMLLESYKEAVERIRQARLWHKRYPADVADRLIELYTVLDKPDEVKKWQAERAKYDASAEAKGQP